MKIKNMKNKRNFLSDLQPTVFLLKYTGFLPIFKQSSLHKVSEPRFWKTCISWLLRILLVIFLLWNYNVMTDIHTARMLNQPDTSTDDQMLNLIVTTIIYLVLVLHSGFNASKVVKIINMLLSVDQQLQKQYNFMPKSLRDFTVKFLIWVFAGHCYIIPTVALKHISLSGGLFLSANLFMSFLAVVIVTFICVFMRILAKRFVFLNNMLKCYTYESQIKLFGKLRIQTSQAMLHLSKENLLFIFRMHNQLLYTLTALNDYCATILLCSLIILFYFITTLAYRIFMLMITSELEFYKLQFVVAYQVQYISSLVFISFCCGEVVREANNTNKILAKIYEQEQAIQYLIDKFMTKSIKQLAKISAHGFFNVDESMLFKIFSSVTTYMVILIQFKQLQLNDNELNELTE